jgi:hypothetical protein
MVRPAESRLIPPELELASTWLQDRRVKAEYFRHQFFLHGSPSFQVTFGMGNPVSQIPLTSWRMGLNLPALIRHVKVIEAVKLRAFQQLTDNHPDPSRREGCMVPDLNPALGNNRGESIALVIILVRKAGHLDRAVFCLAGEEGGGRIINNGLEKIARLTKFVPHQF